MRAEAEARGLTSWRYGVAAALLAILVGIGLGRFAYSPLMPTLVEARWLTPGEAGYLGAGNLVGYLLGAWAGRHFARWWPPRWILRVAMLLAAASYLLSLWPVFAWLLAWRAVAGVAGGTLMVVAATLVLPRVPAERRGAAAGVIFAGVGIGILLSATIVPALATAGPVTTWISIGLLGTLATALAWCWWPEAAPSVDSAAADGRPAGPVLSRPVRRALWRIYAIYGLVAVGLVPHMVFLVDYVARGLDFGLRVAGVYWTVFGLGAVAGPVAAGRIADRVGFRATLGGALVLQGLCVLLPAVSDAPLLLMLSSAMIGASVPGTVPLALGRIGEILPDPLAQRAAWSTATIFFAVGQAVSGYLCSHLFAATGDYRALFVAGSAALAVALAISLLPGSSQAAEHASRYRPDPRHRSTSTPSKKGGRDRS